jgi:hypothetical protein
MLVTVTKWQADYESGYLQIRDSFMTLLLPSYYFLDIKFIFLY